MIMQGIIFAAPCFWILEYQLVCYQIVITTVSVDCIYFRIIYTNQVALFNHTGDFAVGNFYQHCHEGVPSASAKRGINR